MKINIKKLEENGYIVDQNQKAGIIHIYPHHGNTKLFDALYKTLDNFDVKQSGMIAEGVVIKIQNQRIMELCNEE